MLVVFGFALLLLAAAIVVLFAMLAELASRVPERNAPLRDSTLRALDEARLGHAPGVWPAGLPDAERAVLLVLSTACGSCRDVAEQLAEHADWSSVGVVVSTSGRANAEEFIERYGLGRLPHYVDENGAWVSGEFEVRTSPAALVFLGGRLVSAQVFNDVVALRAAVETRQYETRHMEAM